LVDDDEASSASSKHSDYAADDSKHSEEKEIDDGQEALGDAGSNLAVKGTRNGKQGAPKTPAKAVIQKGKTAQAATVKKKSHQPESPENNVEAVSP
jgi:hypothetical protein